MRGVAVADEQRLQLLVADARENRGIGDLVAVQIQDRQYRAVTRRIDKLVRMPRRSKRSGLGLPVAHHAGYNEVGTVERHAVRMGEAVPELAPFVDRTGGFRGHVRSDLTGKGKLLEEFLHPLCVFALVGINFGIGPFEIGRAQYARGAVAGPGHENHVEIVLDDHPVQMDPCEGQRRARTPMAEQPVLHMLCLQGLLEERIVLEVDHPDRKIIASPPIRIHQFQFLIR